MLSDHGQSQGATFLHRYGVTLEDLVREACEAGARRGHAGGEDEALAYLGAGLTEIAGDDTTTGRAVAVGHARAPRRRGGDAALGRGREVEQRRRAARARR